MLKITYEDRVNEISVVYARLLVKEKVKIFVLVTGGALLTLYCFHIISYN